MVPFTLNHEGNGSAGMDTRHGTRHTGQQPVTRLRLLVLGAGLLLFGSMLCGCREMGLYRSWEKISKKLSPEGADHDSLKYLGKADLNYYTDTAGEIAYPDVSEPIADEVQVTDPPRRIRHPREEDIWDMTLMEAIHLALANNKLIRDRGQFLSPANVLLNNPDVAPSVYDPAIQQSGILLGRRGVEAALADFDALFTTNMLWGRDEQIANSVFQSGQAARLGETIKTESANFSAQLQKPFATGGTLTLQHDWNYQLNNLNNFSASFPTRSQLFPSTYTGFLQAQYRQPLWAGAGTEFTRIAGPIGQNIRGVSGVGQGVVIARINEDISIADFESSVRNLLRDTETLYWDLALAYRSYHAEVVAYESALDTWRQVKAKFDTGQATQADEAQARDNYYESRSRREDALASLYATETQLRRILALPVNDGRVIRPVDEPTTAEFIPDWHVSLAEALTRRVELRRQKWNIKSLQLQLKAAKSLTRPRLDFVSSYRVNGFGDQLFGKNDDDRGVAITDIFGNVVGISSTRQGLHSAYETLTQGDQTGWNLGFEFSMPFGFRAAHSQVRNLELRLAKARAALSAQELEVSHELANAFQEVDRWYQTARTNFNRRRAAELRVQATQAEYEVGRTSLDLLLRAQISLAQAEVSYFRSLVEYNKAIATIHYRKGTLLEEDNVQLAEGLWDPDAYLDALRRAWSRSHAFHAEHLHTDPVEFVTDGPPSIEFEEPVDDSLNPASEVPVPADAADSLPEALFESAPDAGPQQSDALDGTDEFTEDGSLLLPADSDPETHVTGSPVPAGSAPDEWPSFDVSAPPDAPPGA